MTPGYLQSNSMTMTSSTQWGKSGDSTADWEQLHPHVNVSMNATDDFQSSHSRPSLDRRKQSSRRSSDSTSNKASLGDHFDKRSVISSRTSAQSLSGLDARRRRHSSDGMPSARSTRSSSSDRSDRQLPQNDTLSVEQRRQFMKESGSSSSKMTRKYDRSERNTWSQDLDDLESEPHRSNSREVGSSREMFPLRSKLSTIRSQRLIDDSISMPGDMKQFRQEQDGLVDDYKPALSTSTSETPQDMARRQLMVQQKSALKMQSQSLVKDNAKPQPSLGAFFSQSREDESDAAPSGYDKDEESDDDNDTFFSMFQWSTIEGEKKAKKSGSKSVGGECRSTSSGSANVIASDGSRDKRVSKAVAPTNRNLTRSSCEVSERGRRSLLLLSNLYGPGCTDDSGNDEDSTGHLNTDRKSTGDVPPSSLRESLKEERRIARRESRSRLERAHASAANIVGNTPIDDVRKTRSKSKSKSSRSKSLSRLSSEKKNAVESKDSSTPKRSKPLKDSARYDEETATRSLQSRRKSGDSTNSSRHDRRSVYDTDNDKQSRSNHSRRRDETKDERKERKKAEKEESKEKERRNLSKDVDEDRRQRDSSKGASRRASSNKSCEIDGEDGSKAKKKKDSRRRSERDDLTRRGNESAAGDGIDEPVSRRRSRKSTAADRENEGVSRRRSKADRDDEGVSRRCSKNVAGHPDIETLPSHSRKSAGTVSEEALTRRGKSRDSSSGGKKSRSSSKRNTGIKSKEETFSEGVTEVDSTILSRLSVIPPQASMIRREKFVEDSDSDHSIKLPKANSQSGDPLVPIGGTSYDSTYNTEYDSRYETNIEDEFSDEEDLTVVHLSDTDDEDDNSHVSQIEADELFIAHSHTSASSEELERVLLQFEPSQKGNIERISHNQQSPGSLIRIQNVDGSHTEGVIMGMPETSFIRANSTSIYESEFVMGSTLTARDLGRHKSVRRLIKKRTGGLFRRDKSTVDEKDSATPDLSHDKDVEGIIGLDPNAFCENDDFRESTKVRALPLRRSRK